MLLDEGVYVFVVLCITVVNIYVSVFLYFCFSLVDRLPLCNQHLLRHLMCVLYHIASLSGTNNMDSYNLSVCIAQCLLWLPVSKSSLHRKPVQPTTVAKNICSVVQALLDNCCAVFGDSVTTLYGELPASKPHPDSSTDSDSVHSLLSTPDMSRE